MSQDQVPHAPVHGDPEQHMDDSWGHDALEAEHYGGTWVRPLDHLPTDHSNDQLLAGGVGGAGGSKKSKGNKPTGPKPIRGPRFSASPMVAGLGLLSLLIVIAIMAILAVKVLGAVDGKSSEEGGGRAGGGAALVAPGVEVPDAGGLIDGTSATEAATAVTCATTKATIETAAQAYLVTNGSAPASVDDIVAAGLMSENPGTFTLEASADGAKAVGIGVCAGT